MFNEADNSQYTFNVNATGDYEKTGIASVTAYEGQSSVLYYSKYISDENGAWYSTTSNGTSGDVIFYGVNVSGAGSLNKTFSKQAIDSFTEIESLNSSSSFTNLGTASRASNGQAPRLAANQYVYTAPFEAGGTFDVTLGGRGASGSAKIALFTADSNGANPLQVGEFGEWSSGEVAEKTLRNVVVPAGKVLLIKNTTSSISGLEADYLFYVQLPVTYTSKEGVIDIQENANLTPEIKNTSANTRFSSNYQEIASVNETTGEITGHQNGTAVITATDNGHSDTFTVTVKGEKANYTVKWIVEGESEPLKTEEREGEVFGSIELSAEDKADMTKDGKTYVYAGDDASGKKIERDDLTVVTIWYNVKAQYEKDTADGEPDLSADGNYIETVNEVAATGAGVVTDETIVKDGLYTLGFGNPGESQFVAQRDGSSEYGFYCKDDEGHTFATVPSGLQPTNGTYYTITPAKRARLSISGWLDVAGDIILTDGSQEIAPSGARTDVRNGARRAISQDTTPFADLEVADNLEADKTYYLYATADQSTLYLSKLTLTLLDEVQFFWGTEDTPLTEATMTVGDQATPTLTNNASLPVTYSSSDPAVATIDDHGQVYALSAGTTIITAQAAGNKETTYTLTVEDAKVLAGRKWVFSDNSAYTVESDFTQLSTDYWEKDKTGGSDSNNGTGTGTYFYKQYGTNIELYASAENKLLAPDGLVATREQNTDARVITINPSNYLVLANSSISVTHVK